MNMDVKDRRKNEVDKIQGLTFAMDFMWTGY